MRNIKKSFESGKYIRPEVKVIEIGLQFSVLTVSDPISEEQLQ